MKVAVKKWKNGYNERTEAKASEKKRISTGGRN